MIRVTHFQRKRRPIGNYSIESYFQSIRDLSPADMAIVKKESTFYSNGILRRLYNMIEVIFRQSDINHITGDVHYLTLLLPGSKTILTVHDCGSLRVYKGWKQAMLKYFWYDLPCQRVRLITVNSEYTKKDLLSYVNVPPDKIKVHYVTIADHFRPYPKKFNKEKPVILQLGAKHNKNLHRIIPALEGIPCLYQIVGDPPPDILESLHRHQIDYELIERAVSDEELLALYRACDIVSFASTLEGFGMPIVEGNAIGRVVLTSGVTSMPEVAEDAAHLVDPFDIESIRTGFQKIILDDAYRDRLIANGFENAKRFNNRSIADQFFADYRELTT